MTDTTLEERIEDFLEHSGVKGMKWGRRKANGAYRNLSKAQSKYDRTVSKNWWRANNLAADDVNSGRNNLLAKSNSKISRILKKEGVTRIDAIQSSTGMRAYDKVIREHQEAFNALLQTKVVDLYGERPS